LPSYNSLQPTVPWSCLAGPGLIQALKSDDVSQCQGQLIVRHTQIWCRMGCTGLVDGWVFLLKIDRNGHKRLIIYCPKKMPKGRKRRTYYICVKAERFSGANSPFILLQNSQKACRSNVRQSVTSFAELVVKKVTLQHVLPDRF